MSTVGLLAAALMVGALGGGVVVHAIHVRRRTIREAEFARALARAKLSVQPTKVSISSVRFVAELLEGVAAASSPGHTDAERADAPLVAAARLGDLPTARMVAALLLRYAAADHRVVAEARRFAELFDLLQSWELPSPERDP